MQPVVWKIGDVTITSVVEVEWPGIDMTWLFPDATPDRLLAMSDWLRPHFISEDGHINFIIQTFVVESQSQRIVVDTCVGNDKPHKNQLFSNFQTPFLERLVAAGFEPASIDTVLCTHMHLDHVGWNTRLEDGRWVPTFPNARYLFDRTEWAHWQPVESAAGVLDDSVRPVFDAGLADLVDENHRVTEEVSLFPTPGHTPGHASVRIVSGDAQAVITGDLMHQPFQCAHPEWGCGADSDPERALETRRALLAALGDQPTLLIGSHFARPTAGHVVRDGESWRFVVDSAFE